MKEFQEFLLRQLKENKLVLSSIDFKHSVAHSGEVNIIGINHFSFTSAETSYNISKIIVPELKEEVLRQFAKCFD